MANQPVPHQPAKSGSPYCSDPNCEYCKKLREMEEQTEQEHRGVRKKSDGATVGQRRSGEPQSPQQAWSGSAPTLVR